MAAAQEPQLEAYHVIVHDLHLTSLDYATPSPHTLKLFVGGVPAALHESGVETALQAAVGDRAVVTDVRLQRKAGSAAHRGFGFAFLLPNLGPHSLGLQAVAHNLTLSRVAVPGSREGMQVKVAKESKDLRASSGASKSSDSVELVVQPHGVLLRCSLSEAAFEALVGLSPAAAESVLADMHNASAVMQSVQEAVRGVPGVAHITGCTLHSKPEQTISSVPQSTLPHLVEFHPAWPVQHAAALTHPTPVPGTAPMPAQGEAGPVIGGSVHPTHRSGKRQREATLPEPAERAKLKWQWRGASVHAPRPMQ